MSGLNKRSQTETNSFLYPLSLRRVLLSRGLVVEGGRILGNGTSTRLRSATGAPGVAASLVLLLAVPRIVAADGLAVVV
jgi:hypothetical protein